MSKWGFDFKHLKGDLLGGITAGIVALPLALAFGLQSGLGAAAGLYGAIFISFFAALFGGTNTQISGPTAPLTAVSMVLIATIVANFEGSVSKALPIIMLVFFLAGLFQILLGLLKVGDFVRYIPYPVVSGFMTGIGVIILITQLLPFVGYYPKEDKSFVDGFKIQAEEVLMNRIIHDEAQEQIWVLENLEETAKRVKAITPKDIDNEAQNLAGAATSGVWGNLNTAGRALKHVNWTDLGMALLTILIIYGFKRITKAIPSTLVALLIVSLGAYFMLPDYRSIGNIPSGFPSVDLSFVGFLSPSYIGPYVLTAFSLALLGAIDSLLTSIVADNLTNTRHNSNQELIGQGIGNGIAALFGGIPGAGATIRTVVNINSGGKTKLSGMMAGLLLLLILLLLGPLASQIPAAVLAGILITVGIGVMDYKGLRDIPKLPKVDLTIMLLVLFMTVFVGLIEAVIAGFVLACFIFMTIASKQVKDQSKMLTLEEMPSIELEGITAEQKNLLKEKLAFKLFDGSLFFGIASDLNTLIKSYEHTKYLIIDLEEVHHIDQSGIYALEKVFRQLEKKAITIALVHLNPNVKKRLKKFNFLAKYKTFEETATCIDWLLEQEAK